jgi:hypothetical protein
MPQSNSATLRRYRTRPSRAFWKSTCRPTSSGCRRCHRPRHTPSITSGACHTNCMNSMAPALRQYAWPHHTWDPSTTHTTPRNPSQSQWCGLKLLAAQTSLPLSSHNATSFAHTPLLDVPWPEPTHQSNPTTSHTHHAPPTQPAQPPQHNHPSTGACPLLQPTPHACCPPPAAGTTL